jgi:hypothetical protein
MKNSSNKKRVSPGICLFPFKKSKYITQNYRPSPGIENKAPPGFLWRSRTGTPLRQSWIPGTLAAGNEVK